MDDTDQSRVKVFSFLVRSQTHQKSPVTEGTTYDCIQPRIANLSHRNGFSLHNLPRYLLILHWPPLPFCHEKEDVKKRTSDKFVDVQQGTSHCVNQKAP